MRELASLVGYFQRTHSESELRCLPVRLGLTIDEAMPGIGVSREELATEFALILERRNLIDRDLIAGLMADRPARETELRAIASILLGGVATVGTESRIFIRSEAFSFSKAFCFDTEAPASALLEHVVSDMILPRRESIRDVVIVSFTYRLSGPTGDLSLERTLGAQRVDSTMVLNLLAETHLIPIAPHFREASRRRIILRGDD